MPLRPASLSLACVVSVGVLALAGVLPWLPAADDAPTLAPAATLKGHTEAIYSLAFTPDGKYVVTGSGDHSIKVWDSATGKEFKTFGGPAGHKNLVLSISLSPDGSLIASSASDNTAKLWDFPSNSPLRDIAKSEGTTSLSVSPDGLKVAGAGKDGSVTLWNAADGKELFRMTGHTGAVTGLTFSPNGQLLVSCGEDKTVRFWNPANGQAVAVIGAHPAAAAGVAFSPNNNAVYSAGTDGSLKFWALPPVASRMLPAQGGAVTALALSADNNQILSGSADKSVRLSTLANGQPVRTFTGAAAAVESVALSPNGALVAAGTADRRLLVWQAKDGQTLANVLAHGGKVNGVAFNPASNQLLTGGEDGQLKLWAMPPTPARTLTHPDAVHAATASADGKRLFTGGADKMVRAWNLAAPQMAERQFSGHTAAVNAVAVSANGQALASAGDDETIRFWNQANGQQTALLGAHAGPVNSLSFNPAGQVLSASADGSVKLWQPPAAAAKPLVHPGPVTSAVLSPDGTRLLTGCGDKTVRLWNLSNAQVERPFAGHTLGVLCVALNAAGNRVAAGGADKTLWVWDTANGKEVKKFTLPAAVNGVAFSPDGKLVAGGLADSTIRLLDLTSGKEVKSLSGHKGAVNALAFTAKGEIVSASADKTVQVWGADGKSKATLDHGAAVQALALSKDGTRLAGAADRAVKVWTLADGKLQATIATPAVVHAVSFSPDGTRLLIGGADNRARVYGLDGQLIEFSPHEGAVLAVAFHGDGKRVFTAGADKTVRPWSLSLTWQARHNGPVRQAVFSGKYDRVVSCGDDKTVRVWNAADGKLIKTLDAHAGPVLGVSVSADGGRIASCGADKTVKVFTLPAQSAAKEDKPLVITLPSAAGAVALSPNGLRVAAAVSDDKNTQLRVFDVPSGKELLVLDEHTGAIRSLAFLADNRTLVSASADKTARLTDANVLAVFDPHAGGVAGVAFHSNGTQAISGGADKTVKLWETATGKVLRTFGPLAEPVRAVVFNRACTQVAASAGKSVIVWNVADGKQVRTLAHPAEVLGLSFSADGTRLATAAADNLARAWDLATGHELQAFLHTGPVRAVVCPGNNNALVVSGSADKTIAVHTITAARALATGGPVRALAVVTNGTHVLTAGDDGKVKLWNTGNGANDRSLDGGGKAVHSLAVSKNNLLLAAGGADQTVRLYTLADGKLLAAIKAPGVIRGLTITPNSQTLAAVCAPPDNGASVIQTWNVVFTQGQPLPAEFGKPVQTYGGAGALADLAFAPNGSTFYSASADRPVKVWKFAADTPAKNLQHPNLVDAVAFNPAGTQVATGCHDGRVRIFDVAKGTVVRDIAAHTLPAPGAAVYCVAWSPDGKQIVSGSFDRSLKLWDAAAGKLVRELKPYTEKTFEKGHREGVYTVAFAPDGKTIASGGGDHAVKVWNVADGSVLRELANPKIKPGAIPLPPQAHPGSVYNLRYSPDGKYLVSVGPAPHNKGFLAIWNSADGKMVHGEELPLGPFFSVAVSADGKRLAVGSGGSTRGGGEANNGYVLHWPLK